MHFPALLLTLLSSQPFPAGYKVSVVQSRIDSFCHLGPLAQLGERRVRNAEVVGSSPMRSTNLFTEPVYISIVFPSWDPNG